MDGVARASGAGFLVVRIPKCFKSNEEPNGPEDGFDEFQWPAMRVEDYAVLENHLLKNRVSPIDAVLPELERLQEVNTKASRRLMKSLEEKAYRDLRKSKAQNKLTIEEVQNFIDSPEGVLMSMKITLQRKHPNITDADVRRIFDWLGKEEAKRLRDVAQGTDRLGNSTGPTESPDAAGRNPDGASTGENSTAGSPANTGGVPATSTS